MLFKLTNKETVHDKEALLQAKTLDSKRFLKSNHLSRSTKFFKEILALINNIKMVHLTSLRSDLEVEVTVLNMEISIFKTNSALRLS